MIPPYVQLSLMFMLCSSPSFSDLLIFDLYLFERFLSFVGSGNCAQENPVGVLL